MSLTSNCTADGVTTHGKRAQRGVEVHILLILNIVSFEVWPLELWRKVPE
jgi:hypothetical protein